MSQILPEFREPLSELRSDHLRKPLCSDEIASHPVVDSLARSYARHYWKSRGQYVLRVAGNVDKDDFYTVALLAATAAFLCFDPDRCPDILRFFTFRMFQACRREEQRNHAPHVLRTVDVPDQEGCAVDEDEERIEDPDQIILMNQALNKLPDYYRRILLLCYVEQRPYSEIASVLGENVDKSTIMRHQREAINFARQLAGLAPIVRSPSRGLFRPPVLSS